LTITLTVSVSAEEAAGILHSSGGVLVNKNSVTAISALFPGDVVETLANSHANIVLDGSSIEIDSDGVVEFHRDEIVLEHGGVFVGTSRRFRVRSGCVLVTPVSDERTIFKVANTDGKVNVFAEKKDVNIDSRAKAARANQSASSSRATVREGEQKSREEKCGGGDLKSSPVGLPGSILNSPYILGPAGGLGLAATICILKCFDDDPISPAKP
jgi:ferric-dicitrate binding protein FerR (iron transport regulator)